MHPTSKLAVPDQYQSTLANRCAKEVMEISCVVAMGGAAQIDGMAANNDKAFSNKLTIGGSRRHDELRNKVVVKNRVKEYETRRLLESVEELEVFKRAVVEKMLP
ncbi:MAG: hypothetical protein HETSPECPRED_003521 [Heterodermia speciosa]|uniref:Uncharacterized protein n=1 Tax=Heterodermia speciosa TaxID=116794 RepID=A0A8H3F5S5_9LECA|nr:MAG: hypothetical protein HETSPECPRED_003521 [Heterodermia speciosa]